MKIPTLAGLLLIAGASALVAETKLDANEDSMVTMEEMAAVYPDVSTDTFSAADTDDSGALDAAELAAAQEAGLIPAEM